MTRSADEQKPAVPPRVPCSIDWYTPGQPRIVEVAGVLLATRIVDRNRRRARIFVRGVAARCSVRRTAASIVDAPSVG
jgi:hypothetical protein